MPLNKLKKPVHNFIYYKIKMKYSERLKAYLKTVKNTISVNEYIKTLSAMELQTLEIAIDHLESSFNIEKSIGYVMWLKNNAN